MLKMRLILFVLATSAQLGSASAAGCYDLEKNEPRSLTGRLEYVMFPGPPDYMDVQKGDIPMPTYMLRLPSPICITGDGFADPKNPFSSVHLMESKKTTGQLRRFLNQSVTLSLTEPFARHYRSHYAPLVVSVAAINVRAAKAMDFFEEMGTSATIIRAFYAALGDGQGAIASEMIVPEKRSIPAFTPDGLTRFYGNLKQPIELIEISQNSSNSYVAHYRYATANRVCDGKAVVTTVSRADRNFIQAIKPLNGC
jgi:hypothetical protein